MQNSYYFFFLYTYGFENIETRLCSTYENSGNLWMPMKFFNVFLSLMNKQKLRWNFLSKIIKNFKALNSIYW